MEPVIIAVLIGIVVYAVIVACIPGRILAEPTRYTKQMLDQLEQESVGHADPESNTASIMRKHMETATLLSRIFFTLPGATRAYPLLLRAGLQNNIDSFFLFCLILVLLLIYLTKSVGVWGILIAIGATYFAAWRYIKRRIKKRNDSFLNSFPDALDMIVRSVRSGYPLNAAIRMVAENMQPPVSVEFKQVADETAYGSTLMEALQRLAQRIDESDIQFFVVVLAVQQEVGGNLAEVLGNLSGIIRKRKHLRLKIRALTSEGRATAWVLGSLPVFVFVLLHFISPTHLDPFFTTRLGNLLLASAIGIVVIGMLIVRKMINIEV